MNLSPLYLPHVISEKRLLGSATSRHSIKKIRKGGQLIQVYL